MSIPLSLEPRSVRWSSCFALRILENLPPGVGSPCRRSDAHSAPLTTGPGVLFAYFVAVAKVKAIRITRDKLTKLSHALQQFHDQTNSKSLAGASLCVCVSDISSCSCSVELVTCGMKAAEMCQQYEASYRRRFFLYVTVVVRRHDDCCHCTSVGARHGVWPRHLERR